MMVYDINCMQASTICRPATSSWSKWYWYRTMDRALGECDCW